MKKNFRILPIFIFFAFLMLSIRINNVFDSLHEKQERITFVSQSIAENKGAKEEDELGKILDKNEKTALLSPDSAQTVASNSEVKILQELAERREALEVRSREIDKKAIQLKVTEEQIEQKLSQLKQYEQKLYSLMKDYDEHEKEKINSLVKLYSTMKPKDAARIFDTMDIDIVVALLKEMKPSTSSAILSQMDVKKTQLVTNRLIGNEI
ncbi:MAG: hypothetical protein PHE89_03105 [Alphaproteobacteria bacterium]|nr:hypothetical protein [Alphaproteobacteria bacterium]